MREHLFRGKRMDNGEWVEGGIVHQTNYYGDPWDAWFIIDGTDTPRDFNIGPDYRVEPDTVGEYASKNDRNGVRIFEGDIVKWEHGIVPTVQVSFWGRWVLRYRDTVYTGLYGLDESKLAVIGNVHDNPKLLTG